MIMPRGRKKNKSLDEQIAETMENIQITENSLKTLKKKLCELEEQKRQQIAEELVQTIEDCGMTLDEAKELLLTSSKKEDAQIA